MKKTLIAILLLCLVHGIYAQDSTSVKKFGAFNSVEIGVMFAPQYNFRTFSFEGQLGADNYQGISKQRNGDEGIFGVNLGLRVSLFLHQNMGIEFGMGYSKKGYLHDAVKSTIANALIYERYDILYRNHYIDIPVKFVARTSGKRLRFRASLGLVTQVFIEAQKVRTITPVGDDSYQKEEPVDKNPINLAPTVSVGLDVTVTPKFGLRLEPMFQHQLFKTDNEALEVRYWQVGVGLTAYFNRAGQ
jgi:hypothetical protein